MVLVVTVVPVALEVLVAPLVALEALSVALAARVVLLAPVCVDSVVVLTTSRHRRRKAKIRRMETMVMDSRVSSKVVVMERP